MCYRQCSQKSFIGKSFGWNPLSIWEAKQWKRLEASLRYGKWAGGKSKPSGGSWVLRLQWICRKEGKQKKISKSKWRCKLGFLRFLHTCRWIRRWQERSLSPWIEISSNDLRRWDTTFNMRKRAESSNPQLINCTQPQSRFDRFHFSSDPKLWLFLSGLKSHWNQKIESCSNFECWDCRCRDWCKWELCFNW